MKPNDFNVSPISSDPKKIDPKIVDFTARIMAGETVKDDLGSTWKYGYFEARNSNTATEKKNDILIQSANIAVRVNKYNELYILEDSKTLPQEIIKSIHGPKVAEQYKDIHFARPNTLSTDFSTLKPANDRPLLTASPSERVKIEMITDNAALLRHSDNKLSAHTLKQLGVKRDDLKLGDTMNLTSQGKLVKDLQQEKKIEQTVSRSQDYGKSKNKAFGIGY